MRSLHSHLLAVLLLLLHLPFSVDALPTDSLLAPRAAPPVQYTANPSVGSGSGSFKDSAHFRVYNAPAATSDQTLKILEAAHSCFVETLGWRTPGLSINTPPQNGAEVGPWYKMNIYQVPSSEIGGAAGAQWTDGQKGLAFLKVVGDYIANPGVIVHEFGHAMHYSEKNWVDQIRTGAWWEPIANYIAELYIATPTCSVPKRAAGLPDGDSTIDLRKVIGDSFQTLVDGTSGSGNYYQSWPFLSYIENNPDNFPGLGNQTLLNMIRKYKLNSNETPLHSLERLLSGSLTVQRIVGRYWARMAFVDIGHAKAKQLFDAQRRNLNINYANLDTNGNGKYTVKSARAPRYMGANVIPLKNPGSSVSVTINVNAGGSYAATLAVKAGNGSVRYVDVVGGTGNVAVAVGEELMLVVANTPALVLYDPFKIPAEVNKGLGYSVQISGATV